MKIIENIKRRWRYYKMTDRRILKTQILLGTFIGAGVGSFAYAIVSVILGLPLWFALLPVLFLVLYILFPFIKRNFASLWLFVRHPNRGRLLYYLTENTTFSQAHKDRLIKWTYLTSREVRNERFLKLQEKAKNNEELTQEEKAAMNKKVVFVSQQTIDGVNLAFTIDALIFAHRNIKPLDANLREILKLSDDNMTNFDLKTEINKCRTRSARANYDKLMQEGLRKMKEKEARNG